MFGHVCLAKYHHINEQQSSFVITNKNGDIDFKVVLQYLTHAKGNWGKSIALYFTFQNRQSHQILKSNIPGSVS